MKKIVVDLDGILTVETQGFGKGFYPKRTPNKYNIETLYDLKRRGYKIVIHSARYVTDELMTVEWLAKHNVPYDELILGKPQADQYVDDKACSQLDREVLCFSGGIDSLIGYHFLNFPQPLYVMMGHRYEEKEMNCIENLKKIIPRLKNVDYHSDNNLGCFEYGDNAYIPGRNLHLALDASHYGNKIYICGVKGDKVEDKNETAFSIMSFAINSIRKKEEPKISIESPFWNMTKTDIIKWFIDNYPKPYVEKVLRASVSCYDTSMGNCGNCKSCFRKWISLEAAGVKSYDWFMGDIRKWKEIKNYKKRIEEGYYDLQRSRETQEVLEKYHLW
jgi:7-cyano-7-deazaguanine synthase in queuosine biosynthesis